MSADFIKMVSEIHGERFLVQFQNLIRNKIPCGFFMDFSVMKNLADIINFMRNSGLNITCICCVDANQTGGGTENLNIPLVTLEELKSYSNKLPVMFHGNATLGPAFYDYFKSINIDLWTLADTNLMERIYNFYIENLPNLYTVHEMLSDEESKKFFRAFLKGKITQRTRDLKFAPEPQYFLEGFLPTEGDIAIDGGAYDGATARDFSMCGARVYAFEMDAKNYQNCLPLAEKYNFVIENLGLSDREGEEFYSQSGAASGKGRGNVAGKFIDLDTYVERKNLPRVDYIKLDIEGAELDMLHGAFKTIARWKPKMAVSAYHKPEDLWTLATYIKSLRPDYEFKFRHYRMDCSNYVLTDENRAILKKFNLSYHLPTVAENVLYCR